ncbi:MAG: methyltransferase domain-containing protein [Dehalococcoidales bacterium]|nr:methyltransferase domain-containing protein [Dehalococcoidales bacterium]
MKSISSLPMRCWLGIQQRLGRKRLPVYAERLGYLRRLIQIGSALGFDQGLCLDRYYIEKFLSAHALDIQGRVLEIGDDTYTQRFGGGRVTGSDILNKTEDNPQATIIADLTSADNIAQDTFDCVILTQTLQYVYDLKAAILTLYRILKPGGVVLATIPVIAHISRYDLEHWGEYWRLTSLSAERLFGEVFSPENLEVQAHGNLLTAMAFLCGLPADGFRQEELDNHHPDFQLLLTVRAVKPGK